MSNRTCERRHACVDLTMRKMMDDDKDIKLEEALQDSLWARNVEIGHLGETPFKVMFGRTPIYPGITDGNVITDNSIESSEAVKRHFHNMEKARTFH